MSKLRDEASIDPLRQVFSSIAYCHSKDVVHRDLKLGLPEKIPAPPTSGLVLGGSDDGFLVHETNKTTPELGGPSSWFLVWGVERERI